MKRLYILILSLIMAGCAKSGDTCRQIKMEPAIFGTTIDKEVDFHQIFTFSDHAYISGMGGTDYDTEENCREEFAEELYQEPPFSASLSGFRIMVHSFHKLEVWIDATCEMEHCIIKIKAPNFFAENGDIWEPPLWAVSRK